MSTNVTGNQTRVLNAAGKWQRMEYDAANRLVAVKGDAGGWLARYTYGSSNARLTSEEGGVRTYYAWGGSGVVAEYTETGSQSAPQWTKTYIHMGGRLLATHEQAGGGYEYIEYHHPDRLGVSGETCKLLL